MVVDANMYWFPEELFEDETMMSEFLSEIPKIYNINGYCKSLDDGKKQIAIEKPTGYENLNYIQGDYCLENMLSDMDAAGVDQAVLKVPGCSEWMSLNTCKMFNDGMARYARESQGRMIPLMVVPPSGREACLDEIDRCREELGMQAVQLCTHYGNYYLDDDMFADFFAKLNEQKTTVYIHHVPVPVEYDSLYDYNNLRRSYGRCVDQGIAIGRELFSGFFEKYPNLTFVHSMLGGGFFAIENMLFPARAKTQEQVKRFETDQGDIKELYKKHVYFEMSHAQPWGKAQLECAVKVLGADHIVFGTSYPVRKEWLLDGPQFVRDLEISESDKDMILGQNAKNLYGL